MIGLVYARLSFYFDVVSPSFSSQRYGQELPQSEVFDYGHGITDRLQKQEKSYRSSGHVQSRGMQKVEYEFLGIAYSHVAGMAHKEQILINAQHLQCGYLQVAVGTISLLRVMISKSLKLIMQNACKCKYFLNVFLAGSETPHNKSRDQISLEDS